MWGLQSGNDSPDYFPGVYPIDYRAEISLRNWHLVNVAIGDPFQRLNQRSEIEADLFSGQEAWDYQNPYVWQSKSVLTVPTLLPIYGESMDTAVSVQNNIARTGFWIEK